MTDIGVVASRRKSNRGCKLRRWTESEIAQLQRLYEAGKSRAEMALALDVPMSRIRERLQYEAQATDRGIARKKRRMAQRELTKNEQQSPRMFFDKVAPGPRPTDEALRLRDIRVNAPPRDLTGAFFGDPPKGFSALEQRS